MGEALAHELRCATASHPGGPFHLQIEELDILRGGAEHDLLVDEIADMCLNKLSNGLYDFILAAPPCNTFSRAVFANRNGPRPVRDLQWPDGFPWLEPHRRQDAEQGTKLVRLSLKALELAAATGHTRGLLEHPEDLVAAARHTSARQQGLWAGRHLSVRLEPR